MSEKYDNSGALFRNDDKDADHPNWPDYQGSATVEGQDYWLSAWIKKGKKGTFMSLAFKPKEQKQEGRKEPEREDSDDCPPF